MGGESKRKGSLISIHLMFRLNEKTVFFFLNSKDFNTSNVSVKLMIGHLVFIKIIYFNTSNVSVKSQWDGGVGEVKMYFNTSNVSVKLGSIRERDGVPDLFQYI